MQVHIIAGYARSVPAYKVLSPSWQAPQSQNVRYIDDANVGRQHIAGVIRYKTYHQKACFVHEEKPNMLCYESPERA